MKKIFTLTLAALAALGLQAKVYTFQDLAEFENCGVSQVDGAWVIAPNSEMGNKDTLTFDDGQVLRLKSKIQIAEGNTLQVLNNEVVKFGDGMQIEVLGDIDFAPADTATFTATDDAVGSAKGFFVHGDNSSAVVKNVLFEYVGLSYGSSAGTGSLTMNNCTFDKYNTKNATGAALNFCAQCDGNVVENCVFRASQVSAIANGSNTPVGIVIRNNEFDKNSTQKGNRPQINMSAGGNHKMIIENNNVIGIGEVTLAGGIAVSNLLGGASNEIVEIRNNHVENNRYGITATGGMEVLIEGNYLLNNNFESNSMQGGSGINITDANGNAIAMITGNHIEGHFWGVSIIGGKDINLGKIVDAKEGESNPGNNVFINNGCNGQLYDLYNNSANTVYAQGNTWNVEVQDAEHIEQVVFHHNDDPSLGEVIFIPAKETVGVTDVNTSKQVAGVKYYNLAGVEGTKPFDGVNVVVTTYTDGTNATTKVIK